jgi:hypothetical protein
VRLCSSCERETRALGVALRCCSPWTVRPRRHCSRPQSSSLSSSWGKESEDDCDAWTQVDRIEGYSKQGEELL